MSSLDDVLHRIRVNLHSCALPKGRGRYYARVKSERVLGIEEVAADAKNRGSFSGEVNEMIYHVNEFMAELAYKLCDGYTVSMGLFSIHPRVSGLFPAADHQNAEINDRDKHRVTFSYQTLPRLRELASLIELVADDAVNGPVIVNFTDFASGSLNGRLSPGGAFRVEGKRIKVKGDNPDCGIWFVPSFPGSSDGASGAPAGGGTAGRVKVTSGFFDNTTGAITGMVPALSAGEYTLEIVTQYTKGGIDMKEPRVIPGPFTLTVA